MTVGRTSTSVRALVCSLLLALAGLAVISPPAHGDPGSDLKKAKETVHQLDAQASAAGERFDAARLRLRESHVRLKALQGDVTRQQSVVDTMRDKVADLLVSQYQGNPLSTASRVVFSRDSSAFIDNLNAASSFSAQQSQVIGEYQVALKRLKLRKQAAADQVAALTKIRGVLADAKKAIDAKTAAAQKKYDDLSAKARAAMMGGNFDYSGLDFAGRAGAAIKYALAQVGKPYVWGATGPGSYDCSGLMLAAWRTVGVSLPHSSRAQAGMGRTVSHSDLQPGDLVFYYSPISHVGMYIGNGMIVNAENPRSGVKVTGVDAMPYTTAVRLG